MFTCSQTGLQRDETKERAAYERKWGQVRLAGHNARQMNLARFIARHELEPDEFQTAEQKARALGYR